MIAAVEGGRVGGTQRRSPPDALDKIRVCNERHAKGNQVRGIARYRRLSASRIVAAVENNGAEKSAPECGPVEAAVVARLRQVEIGKFASAQFGRGITEGLLRIVVAYIVERAYRRKTDTKPGIDGAPAEIGDNAWNFLRGERPGAPQNPSPLRPSWLGRRAVSPRARRGGRYRAAARDERSGQHAKAAERCARSRDARRRRPGASRRSAVRNICPASPGSLSPEAKSAMPR